MNEKNAILNFPFDESKGAVLAYDHSASRADLSVNGADFVAGRNGNAIRFTGEGYAATQKQVLPNLTMPFTLSVYAQSLSVETGTPTAFVWLLNFGGLDNYETVTITAKPDVWYHLVLVRQGDLYNFYVNGQLIKTITKGDTLRGVSVNQDYYGGAYGLGLLDDLKLYDTALTQDELHQLASEQKHIAYSLDGVDFRDYGVHVSASDGIISRPKLKTMQSYSWDDYHGQDVDLNNKYYEPREITLSCFIQANTRNQFITQMSRFMQQFDKAGLQRLRIDVHPIKPLIYEVYCKDDISVSKTWDDNLLVGTFKIKLIEPQPVKMVLKHIALTEEAKRCTITIETEKLVNIYWGDGSVTEDFSGYDEEITHTYAEAGEYFPVITGCIDEIESIRTDAIIVWNKL